MIERLGIRGRLLTAFFGISAFAVLATAAALYAFLQVGNAVKQITRDCVPTALASLQLSRQAEALPERDGWLHELTVIAPSSLSRADRPEH